MRDQILVVDDEAVTRRVHESLLAPHFAVVSAASAREALKVMEAKDPPPVIISDHMMPEMDGITFLTQVTKRWPDTMRILATGAGGQRVAMDALNSGSVHKFLLKPCSGPVLVKAVQELLHLHRAAKIERHLLEHTLNGTIKLLLDVLVLVAPESFQRAAKLRELARAAAIQLEPANQWVWESAAMLHSVGDVTLPPALLARSHERESLSVEELARLDRLPEISAQLLANIPRLTDVAHVVRYHAKNMDGSGPPRDAVKGQDIPLAARALHILVEMLHLEEKGHSRPAALARLRLHPQLFDVQMLGLLITCLSNGPQPGTASQITDCVQIRLNDLQPGMTLAADLVTREGTLVATAGSTLSPAMLEKIHNFSDLCGLKEPIHVRAPDTPA